VTPVERFFASLPAGEWAALRVLNKSEGEGVMAKRDWALLAEATALRHGGREAFLKCIVAASNSAGDETRTMTGRHRLERIRDRLDAIARMSPAVPLVEILECRFLDGFDALLIAMERVTTLHELIREQRAGTELALQVLRRLAPASPDLWHHLDVCPKNVGLTRVGSVVYIDVESFYLGNDEVFELSNLFGKWFRLPGPIWDVVGEDLQLNRNRMAVGVGAVKQAFDLALLAAECSLNGLPPFDQDFITDAWLREMVDGVADERKPLAEFWAERLRPAVESGTLLDLKKLADDLAGFMAGDPQSTPPASWPKEDKPQSASASVHPATPLTDLERDWGELQTKARALRRDALARPEVEQYRQEVAVMAQRYPREASIWNELLLILISYQRDREEALRVVRAARQQLPQDAHLQQMCEIVTMWAAQ
jgi:hypothetical protein